MKKKCMIELDTQTALLTQLELLIKQLTVTNMAQVNSSQVQVLRCDFYGEGHKNCNCVPERQAKEVEYTRNF